MQVECIKFNEYINSEIKCFFFLLWKKYILKDINLKKRIL